MNDWQIDDRQFDDNQIECARCGERFDLSLTRCPGCGASVYPLEGDDESWEVRHSRQPPTQLELLAHSAGLLLVCALLAAAVSLLSYIALRRLFLAGAGPAAVGTAIIASALPGSLAGGYLAGRFARGRFALHGALAGALNLVSPLLLIAHEFGAPFGSTLLLPAALLNPLAGYAGARLALRHLRQELVKELFAPAQDQAALYQELLEKVRFDQDAAERLIAFERRRAPEAGRPAWIESAIRRWERDNR
jgi:hypothetical protein